jgi:hypothetical protein
MIKIKYNKIITFIIKKLNNNIAKIFFMGEGENEEVFKIE